MIRRSFACNPVLGAEIHVVVVTAQGLCNMLVKNSSRELIAHIPEKLEYIFTEYTSSIKPQQPPLPLV